MRQKSEVGKSRYAFKNYVLNRAHNEREGKMSFQRLIGLRILLSVYGFVCCVHVGEQRVIISQKVRS